ncbi:acyl-CoA-binding domain-containing protein 4 [Dorcoceras hygrometricum]|uniref:Acyl-CoA-binding domain-containing protein 4 n=1 Tax=Dorcoceras hygrometricum TaxID=472368 RepID=A0A2Z7DEX6_9LAMI|nr:acyl-CoA-binding domain-containing protein 4 [Dorcoceras hygrometricum]
MIRRLRAKLATERRVVAVIREELDKRAAGMSQELELVMKDNSGLRIARENDVRALIHENSNMLDAMQAMHEEELEEDLVEAEGAMEVAGAPGDGEILE